jgi:hypothetical protein
MDRKSGDMTGTSIKALLTNGNYVVLSTSWDNGNTADVGAVTWRSGTTLGAVGPISGGNSLIGSRTGDMTGTVVTALLTNGNYVVCSPGWDNGLTLDVGAVTWGSNNPGVVGAIAVGNSLIGSVTTDSVGNLGVKALANGHYVVRSSLWNNGAAAVGAVTWTIRSTAFFGGN